MSKRLKIEDQGIAEQLLATFGDGLINGIIKMKVNIIIQEKGTHSPKKIKKEQIVVKILSHLLHICWTFYGSSKNKPQLAKP